MSFDALKGLPAKELQAKLNELGEENFKAKFTTEEMTPVRGAEIRVRRREIARIMTVMKGRKTLKQAKQQQTQLDEELKALGAPHTGDSRVKNLRRRLLRRKAEVERTIRELTPLQGKE